MKTLKQAYDRKRHNAKRRGIDFNLSFDEYSTLLSRAGITVDQIGQKHDQYCLGRFGDVGDYSLHNCRFITVAENNREAARTKPLNGFSSGGGYQAANSGILNHNSKGKVITPWGTFDSLREAERAPGALCKSNAISKRIMRGETGYKYS